MISNEKKLNLQQEILKLPYLVLSVSMLLTIGATYIFYQSAQAKDLSRFQGEVLGVKNRIEILTSTHIAMIKSARGFAGSAEELDQQKFSDFVKSLELVKINNGIQSIGYIKKVSTEEDGNFIEKLEADGYPDFKISHNPSAPDRQTIIFLEPLEDRSIELMSFNLLGKENAWDTLKGARDTGEARATGKLTLQQAGEFDKTSGILVFLPVYKGGKIPKTLEERKLHLKGFIFSPLQANNFLREIHKTLANSEIRITVYDGEKKSENILAQTNEASSSTPDKLVATTDIEVAGRKWIVDYESLPAFTQHSTAGWTPLIFISGLVCSLLIFGMTYLESFARAKAENITAELQESEKEKAYLLEREQNERKRAETANKAKDEFISVVSHELRTPLNAIAGWTKILYAENLSPATKKQALQKIDKNLRLQTAIVEELLEFSQILSGKTDLGTKEVDFSKMFEEVYSHISLLAREKGVLLNKENTLNGQKIWGDAEKLQRVIKNLLSNAVKFTPKDGTVSTKLKRKDSMIEMIISDTGQGIKSEMMPHIFEHFKQGDSSSTRLHGGLGLGLAISRHIVNLHGGTLKAASEGEGKGSVFTVKIPYGKKTLADMDSGERD